MRVRARGSMDNDSGKVQARFGLGALLIQLLLLPISLVFGRHPSFRIVKIKVVLQRRTTTGLQPLSVPDPFPVPLCTFFAPVLALVRDRNVSSSFSFTEPRGERCLIPPGSRLPDLGVTKRTSSRLRTERLLPSSSTCDCCDSGWG